MLNLSEYLSQQNIWNGILRYIQDHAEKYQGLLPASSCGNPPAPSCNNLSASVCDDDVLKMVKKLARKALPQKEYDTFRKAVTALQKGTAASLRRENLYRLFFALELKSDTQAQDLLLNYLHFNELSARSMDEFIVITALKLQLTWEEMDDIRKSCASRIQEQPNAPFHMEEGETAQVYYQIILDRIQTPEDLNAFLDDPENTSFFARTRNTQYLALFDDVELEVLYNGSAEQVIRLVTDYGNAERETIQEYYLSLFGRQTPYENDYLNEEEISSLSNIFENVFMTYDNFLLLVQRKRPVDVSSGTFMLSLLKKLLTDASEEDNDFYVNFLDPGEFMEICNDILIYFGFPVLNPGCDSFDRLLLDVYQETLKEHPDMSNAGFQKQYLTSLRHYLHLIAKR